MSIRLTGGLGKGMPVTAPAGLNTRPTGAKVREAIWSSLQSYLPFRAMLDLFAGSGAMGLEALSRGAGSVVFVENDRRASAAIQKNLTELERRAKAQTVELGDAKIIKTEFPKALASVKGPFDLIYMDPPYDLVEGKAGDWLQMCIPVACANAVIILESRKGTKVSEKCPETLEIFKEKTYGETAITFFRAKGEVQDGE